MPIPSDGGVYGPECECIQAGVGGTVVVIVLGGNRGNGFSVAGHQETLHDLPSILRLLADDVERQLRERAN